MLHYAVGPVFSIVPKLVFVSLGVFCVMHAMEPEFTDYILVAIIAEQDSKIIVENYHSNSLPMILPNGAVRDLHSLIFNHLNTAEK